MKQTKFDYDAIEIGFPNVDKILTLRGGLPRGVIIEVMGQPGAGKTTFATLAMIGAQKKKLKVGYVGAERGYDFQFAEYLGLDLKKMTALFPANAEEWGDKILEWCEAGYGLIVVDSVVGVLPQEQMEDEENNQYGPLAKFLARRLPQIQQAVGDNNVCLLLLNQLRAKIGVFGFGRKYDSAGGYAIKFFSSIRLEIKKISDIKYSSTSIGYIAQVSAWKNRKAPPNRKAYYPIIYDISLSDALREKKLASAWESIRKKK